MDPASVDENAAFFKSEILPQIKAAPGFCALRQMADRKKGRAVVGVVFEDRSSLDAYAAGSCGAPGPGDRQGHKLRRELHQGDPVLGDHLVRSQ